MDKIRCKNHPGVYLPSEKETRDIFRTEKGEQQWRKWDDEQKIYLFLFAPEPAKAKKG